MERLEVSGAVRHTCI